MLSQYIPPFSVIVPSSHYAKIAAFFNHYLPSTESFAIRHFPRIDVIKASHLTCYHTTEKNVHNMERFNKAEKDHLSVF